LVCLSCFVPSLHAGSIVGWGEQLVDTDLNRQKIAAISAGGFHNLALMADGSIAGWGLNNLSQAFPPDGNDYVAIAAGVSHSLALRSDGTITCWDFSKDCESIPEGNDYVAIAAGSDHSLALTIDGRIVSWGWGQNYFYQSDVPDGTDFVAIAAGMYHSLALVELPPVELNGFPVRYGDDVTVTYAATGDDPESRPGAGGPRRSPVPRRDPGPGRPRGDGRAPARATDVRPGRTCDGPDGQRRDLGRIDARRLGDPGRRR